MRERIVVIEDNRRRELFLEAALRDWRSNILQYAREAMEQVNVGAISPTSLQGLVNAAAAGPGRHGARKRLDSLTWYLAWRKLQAGEGDPWLELAGNIIADLTRLEDLSKSLLDDASEEWALRRLQESEHAAAQRELHLEMTEIYLHALANYYEDRRS